MRLRIDRETLETMAHDQANHAELWRRSAPAPRPEPEPAPEFISDYGRWAWADAERTRGRRSRRDW